MQPPQSDSLERWKQGYKAELFCKGVWPVFKNNEICLTLSLKDLTLKPVALNSFVLMKMYRSFATVAFYTIGSRILGFVRTVLIARYLGAGQVSDALTMALKLPSVLRRIFAEGAFNAAFIPMFTGVLSSQGDRDAKAFAQDIFNILLWSLLLVVFVAQLTMPEMLSYLLSGFNKTPERLQYVITYTRITFPFILFISLCAFYSGILNSYDRFAAVASSPMIGNVAIIVVFIALFPYMKDGGEAMAWGALVCGIVQALWVWYPARKLGMVFHVRFPQWNRNTKKFLNKLGPAIAGGGVVQINTLISAAIASYLPAGGVSYIEFAERLNQLPLSVIGTAISTVMLPLLARHFRLKHIDKALEAQNHALKLALYLSLPAAVGLFCLAYPIITVLFERDAFTPAATAATAVTLQVMTLGLPAYVLVKVFTTSFFANEDTKTPLYTALVSMIIDVVLSLALIGSFAHRGIAFASIMASWCNTVLLAFLLYKRGHFHIGRDLQLYLLKIFVICFVTGALLLSASHFIDSWQQAWLPIQVLTLTFFVALGLLIYFGLCHITDTYNFKEFLKNFKKSKEIKTNDLDN